MTSSKSMVTARSVSSVPASICRSKRSPSSVTDKVRKLTGKLEVTGIDIYFGQGDEDEDEDEDEDGDSDEDGVQEFIKHRWNLNAPFSDNRTSSRLRPESFDLINSRLLADGINEGRWQSYISNLKALLKPGGWLQMVELDLSFQSDSGRLRYDDTEPLFLWKRWYDYAMTQMGRNPRVGRQLEQLMMNAGFEAVWHQRLRLEIGRWNQSWSFQANIDPGLA